MAHRSYGLVDFGPEEGMTMGSTLVAGLLAGGGALAFVGSFLVGHALGATTALDHVSDLRRFAECRGERGSEWFFADAPHGEAGGPVAPEGSSAARIVPGAESRWRIRPYAGPLVPGYFELLPFLGRMEHKIVERLGLPNDPAGRLP